MTVLACVVTVGDGIVMALDPWLSDLAAMLPVSCGLGLLVGSLIPERMRWWWWWCACGLLQVLMVRVIVLDTSTPAIAMLVAHLLGLGLPANPPWLARPGALGAMVGAVAAVIVAGVIGIARRGDYAEFPDVSSWTWRTRYEADPISILLSCAVPVGVWFGATIEWLCRVRSVALYFALAFASLMLAIPYWSYLTIVALPLAVVTTLLGRPQSTIPRAVVTSPSGRRRSTSPRGARSRGPTPRPSDTSRTIRSA